ncbi:hypothetical protein N018_26105 (plasmid) [Pseudomonas syringae CC1557]|uniref:Uncharacterized protein n=1 Tax=Pseudomonas syringae CC1557 TaxID=1357279 RepID=W0MYU1_PSESX|nr:hypothetical protein [Pseudomonas syringae]AHG43749.1 hypothetical protein N018_26105 [Pseudomonas syringae CC1557]
MQGKYWSDHQKAHHIEIDGVCWLLDHLKDTTIVVVIPPAPGNPSVTLTVSVEYSSHCVSRGPKQKQTIDFSALGYEHLVIDSRNIRRAFHSERHELSFLLPGIIASFADRRCFFTGKENFLTLELGTEMPGYAPDTKYEIYFNVRKGDGKNTLKLFIESAYVRGDEDAENEPVNFKKADKIKAWKLFLNKIRGTSIKAARNSALRMGKGRK